MSFRLKVFLTVLALTASVIVSTLWLAEASLGDAVDQALDARYEERAAAVRSRREARDRELRLQAGALAQSVRVVAGFLAVADDPGEETAAQLLENLRDELMKPGADGAGRGQLRFQAYDASGRQVATAAMPTASVAFPGWPQDADALRRAIEGGEPRSGILPDAAGDLCQAVLQPVVDRAGGASVGTVVLARTLETDLAGADAAGLNVAGKWIGLRVSGALPRGRSEIALAGMPHLAFRTPVVEPGTFPGVDEVVAFSLQEKLRQKRRLVGRLAVAGLVAAATALLVVAALAHGLTVPVRDLVQATRKVRDGDLGARVPVRRQDELGRLAGAFNGMIEGLALKERYRSLLDVVSDPQVAEALLDGGLELGGEERDVSVVFCDIRGFTPTADGMEPTEVIAMLNAHFTPLTRVVVEHGGVVLQFAGDLILSIFGAPVTVPDHARRAGACALAMIETRRCLNETGDRSIEVGIGIATGRVVTGRMGSADRLNYSVVGSRVNLAARLCAQAAPGQIVVDAATLAGCGADAASLPLGTLQLKGFSKKVAAFALLGLSQVDESHNASRVTPPSRPPTPIA